MKTLALCLADSFRIQSTRSSNEFSVLVVPWDRRLSFTGLSRPSVCGGPLRLHHGVFKERDINALASIVGSKRSYAYS